MNCPVCEDTRMREVEKEGIMIDICPSCKGVWLDRGELDKLMSGVREVREEYNQWYYGDNRPQPQPQPYQAPPQQAPYPPQQGYPPQYGHQPYPPYKDKKYSHYGGYYGKHKKKKSVLDVFGDLFD